MININLTPYEELENPLWWVPDALFATTVALLCYFGVFLYIDGIHNLRDQINRATQESEAELSGLSPRVAAYDKLDSDFKILAEQLTSLKKVMDAKALRYQSVIVAEHLQNLRPEGVWFGEINLNKVSELIKGAGEPATPPTGADAAKGPKNDAVTMADDGVRIIGFAYDNTLVAEFMTNLRATQSQDVDAADIRTHIFFDRVELVQSGLVNLETATGGVIGDLEFVDTDGVVRKVQVPQFELAIGFKRREVQKVEPSIAFNSSDEAMFQREVAQIAYKVF